MPTGRGEGKKGGGKESRLYVWVESFGRKGVLVSAMINRRGKKRGANFSNAPGEGKGRGEENFGNVTVSGRRIEKRGKKP